MSKSPERKKARSCAASTKTATTSWEEEYFAIQREDSFVCLLCEKNFHGVGAKLEAERHYQTHQSEVQNKYRGSQTSRSADFKIIKKIFLTPRSDCDVVRRDSDTLKELSLRICYALAKAHKPLADVALAKQLLLELVHDFLHLGSTRINFDAIVGVLPTSLSDTFYRLSILSDDLERQLVQDMKVSWYYSFCVGVCSLGHKGTLLTVSLRMLLEGNAVKDAFLEATLLPSDKEITGFDCYRIFKSVVSKYAMTSKMVAVLLDTSSELMGTVANLFTSCCKKDTTTPTVMFHTCLSSLARNCLLQLKVSSVFKNIALLIDSELLVAEGREFNVLLNPDQLQRVVHFCEFLPKIRTLKSTPKTSICKQALDLLDDSEWIYNLTFVADLAERILALESSLEEKVRGNVWEVVDEIVRFRDELVEWVDDLEGDIPADHFTRLRVLFEKKTVPVGARGETLSHLMSMLDKMNEALKPFYGVMQFSKSLRRPSASSAEDVERYSAYLPTSGLCKVPPKKLLAEYKAFVAEAHALGLDDDDMWAKANRFKYENMTKIFAMFSSMFGTGYINKLLIKNAKRAEAVNNKVELPIEAFKYIMRIATSPYSPDYHTLKQNVIYELEKI